MRQNNTLNILLVTLGVFFSSLVMAQEEVTSALEVDEILCPSSDLIGVKMITDVCWEGVFPLQIAGATLFGKTKYAPSGRNTDRTCTCSGDISEGKLPKVGVTTGYYAPKYLLTVTKKPYCFPELNGLELASQMGLTSRFNIGNEDNSDVDEESANNQALWSWHLASFPLMHILETLNEFTCDRSGYVSYDLLWLSETLPHHYDSELSAFMVPESILFASPLSMPFLPVDCVAASAGSPIDELIMAQGCYGYTYPITGHTGAESNKVEAKSLIAHRALYFLSRIGMLERTMGEDALCKAQKMPFMKKSMYRWQQIWPHSESSSDESICAGEDGCGDSMSSGTTSPDATGSVTVGGSVVRTGNVSANQIEEIKMNSLNGTCTHPSGQTSFSWGIWRGAKQQSHASYLIYQWMDCCLDLVQFL